MQAARVISDGFVLKVACDDIDGLDKIILSLRFDGTATLFPIIRAFPLCPEMPTESPRCSDVECAINRSSGDWYCSDSNCVPPRAGTPFPSSPVSKRDVCFASFNIM